MRPNFYVLDYSPPQISDSCGAIYRHNCKLPVVRRIKARKNFQNRSRESRLFTKKRKFLIFLGPQSHPLWRLRWNFAQPSGTHVPVGPTKFDLNRCNESPLRGEKPDFWPVSKFNSGSLPLCGKPAGNHSPTTVARIRKQTQTPNIASILCWALVMQHQSIMCWWNVFQCSTFLCEQQLTSVDHRPTGACSVIYCSTTKPVWRYTAATEKLLQEKRNATTATL